MPNEQNARGAKVPCISLLACPFCGSAAALEPYERRRGFWLYGVRCQNHDCHTIVPLKRSEAEAVHRWNSRANAPREVRETR